MQTKKNQNLETTKMTFTKTSPPGSIDGERRSAGVVAETGGWSELCVLRLHGGADLWSGRIDQGAPGHDTLERVPSIAFLWRHSGKRTSGDGGKLGYSQPASPQASTER
jgi:hypothetical protein